MLTAADGTALNVQAFAQSCRVARSDLGTVKRELAGLHMVLLLLQADSRAEPNLFSGSLKLQTMAVMEHCRVVLAELDATLARCLLGQLSSMKWRTSARQETETLCRQVAAHQQALRIAMEATNL